MEHQDTRSGCPIVGLGASAGGLEALREFFDNVPSRTGAAFVVVTHQAGGIKSVLAELLAHHTTMPVIELVADTPVQPDYVYVGAPGREVHVEDGMLRAVERPDASRGLPIDRFFRSLARDRRDRAVGIVLSGGGSDGALGLKEIAGEGGLVMVQAAENARYASMPRSALEHCRADHVLPVAELPAKLAGYLALLEAERSIAPEEPSNELRRLLAILRHRTGHDFSAYKPSTLRRRIDRRMKVCQVTSHEEYANLVHEQPAEVERLFQELLIGVTSFFRDPESFEALRAPLREYLREKPIDGDVRVWVSGCSTGEEAYSIAILLIELGDELGAHFDLQIFATDIDPESIDLARAGAYPPGVIADLGPGRAARFFADEDGAYRVRKELRERIIFAPQNMITDPPFTRLDLVVCRNVLIYFKSDLQRRLLPMFHYALRPGGLLFLGPSETATGTERLFEPLDRKWKIFRRREQDGGGPPRMPPGVGGEVAPLRGPIAGARRNERTGAVVERLLLREVLAPSAVIDRQGNVLHIHGRTGQFLEPAPGGKEEANLFTMAREGLSNEIAIALRRADKADGVPHYRAAKVRSNGGWNSVTLRVQKLTSEPYRGLFVVTFEHVQEAVAPGEEAATGESLDHARMSDMEAELRSAKEIHRETAEELETANEELKSANEELQSTNEELQSTNEELETSKEELQSLNEELHTVNTELQAKLEDLSRINDDMRNLLNSTEIATIFLDGELNIKRYTERAKRVVRLIPSDIGRPIGDLVSQLEYDRELVDDARDVLETLVFKEAEVRSRDGRWYLTRMLPYRTTENKIDGLVITFVDVTGIKALQSENRRIVTALAASATSAFGQDLELRYEWACSGLFGLPQDRIVGKLDADLLPEDAARQLDAVKQRVLDGGHIQRAQLMLPVDGRPRRHDLHLQPLRDADGTVTGLTGVITILDDDS